MYEYIVEYKYTKTVMTRKGPKTAKCSVTDKVIMPKINNANLYKELVEHLKEEAGAKKIFDIKFTELKKLSMYEIILRKHDDLSNVFEDHYKSIILETELYSDIGKK